VDWRNVTPAVVLVGVNGDDNFVVMSFIESQSPEAFTLCRERYCFGPIFGLNCCNMDRYALRLLSLRCRRRSFSRSRAPSGEVSADGSEGNVDDAPPSVMYAERYVGRTAGACDWHLQQ